MKMNKKAMMDDMFDFLFTVVAAIIILLFITMGLSGGQKEKERAADYQIEILRYNENFLSLLKMPINEKETLLDLVAIVSVRDRHEEFNQVVQGMMEKLYPSITDRWGVSIYKEEETIGDTGYLGKYKSYDVGKERCKKGEEGYMGEKPNIREVLIPQVDGTKVRLVYCIPFSLK